MASEKSERRFMQIAVEEMLQSHSEHTNKFDPMVGAVVVDRRGRILARAHRGNFSAGEHAEFTAIMRVASGHDLKGTTLYTTLEPCTTRKPPKKSCTQRILDSGISNVIIGISDPNPEVHGIGIQTLLDHGIVVGFFDNDLAKQIKEANRNFIDFYERASLAQDRLRRERPDAPSNEEKRPLLNASYKDLSQSLIRVYFTERDCQYAVPSQEEKEYLLDNEFLKRDTEREDYIPTYAGLLLFGKTPDRFLPQFVVKALCFARESAEHTPIENLRFPPKEISGPLPQLVDSAVKFVISNVEKVPIIEGTLRKEVPEYPEKVVREVIVNALVHRDYAMADMQVLLEIYPNRIVIKSPGSLIRPISMENLRQFKCVGSRCRNPRIAITFSHMHRMEKLGFGIPTLPILLKRHGLRPPDFDYIDGYFTVTLYGRALSPVAFRIPPEKLSLLNERQKGILDFVRRNGRIASTDCQKEFKVTRDTANRDFQKLSKLGLVKKMGRGRSTHYILHSSM